MNALNYIIGKKEIKKETYYLLSKNTEIIRVLPILIACRDKDFKIVNLSQSDTVYDEYSFKSSEPNIEKAIDFMDKSGILDLAQSQAIKSFVDYVFGIEVGMDTHARKNRAGSAMEDIVEEFIKDLCIRRNLEYICQASEKKIQEKWGNDVAYDRKGGRIADFAIKTDNFLYIIEANYYGTSGSKPDAISRSYQTDDNNNTKLGRKFIWITDGMGWIPSKGALKVAFNELDYMLNIEMLKKDILNNIIE